MPSTFPTLFQAAKSNPPYAYQTRLTCGSAEAPTPSDPLSCQSQLINIPTVLGKTAN